MQGRHSWMYNRLKEQLEQYTASWRSFEWRDGMITTTVTGCARCGGTHQGFVFQPLTNPIIEDNGKVWTHWALCPTNGEPVLLMNKVRNEEESLEVELPAIVGFDLAEPGEETSGILFAQPLKAFATEFVPLTGQVIIWQRRFTQCK